MNEFVEVRTYSYIINIQLFKKLKFQDYKNCLEEVQIKNEINNLEKNKTYVDSLKQDQKEFIKNDKVMLKTQQRFRS